MKPGDRLPPLHPGEMLREEFMVPLGLSSPVLAEAIGVAPERVEALAAETERLTPEMALRLSRALGWTPMMWMAIQNEFDLDTARAALDPGALDLVPNLNASLHAAE